MHEGYLKIGVLKILSKQERSGYDLMKEIEHHTGRKPSPGSMYPLLKSLQKEKLITAKDEGRSTIYLLTSRGRDYLKELLTHRTEMLHHMQKNLQFMEQVCGEKQPGIQRMFQRIIKGKIPFGPFTHDLSQLRDTVLAAAERPLTKQQEQHILKSIIQTKKEIEYICKKS